MAISKINAASIQDGTVVASDIADSTITAAKIADSTITLGKLSATGTKSSSTFLRGDNSFVAVVTDLVGDTTPQLGGNLDPNSNKIAGSLIPSTNDAFDLGATSFVWRDIYTGDLNLTNTGKDAGNEVDGSKGSWTIQEGSDDLFLINRNSGKKYKFKLEEI
tara:strand:+ start:109 stop:594 length:486 start_codon:yes stop_codon:yes gene_type:complete